MPAKHAESNPALRVVHKLRHGAGKCALVIWGHIDCRLLRRESMLRQIKSDNRLPQRHVLHDLEHRRAITVRTRRRRIHADIRSREIAAKLFAKDKSGEFDVIVKPKLAGLGLYSFTDAATT